jgi:hypothetical protein
LKKILVSSALAGASPDVAPEMTIGHEQWRSDLGASHDGVHPGQAGYGLIAWLVLHGGWDQWLDLGR